MVPEKDIINRIFGLFMLEIQNLISDDYFSKRFLR